MHIHGFNLSSSQNGLNFEFEDAGKNGTFHMAIVYEPTDEDPLVYNLAFGEAILSEVNGIMVPDIDDKVVTNNGNMPEVMATVANSLRVFWGFHPNTTVTIKGSTPERTYLYGRIIREHGHYLQGVEYEGQDSKGRRQFIPKELHGYNRYYLIPN